MFICRRFGFAGHRKTHQIGQRPSAGQAALKTGTPDRLGQPANDRPLQRDRCGGGAPGSNVLVKYAGQQVGDCAYRLSGTKHIAKEATVLGPAVVNHIMEIFKSLCTHSLFWQGSLK